MAVPVSAVGTVLGSHTVVIERGRLQFFAQAIGETDPVYTDLDAAVAAGFPDLPVPPTFLFGLKLVGPDPLGWLTDLGVDVRLVLHGTERFDYERMAFAGDELLLEPRIADVYAKRGGALEFIVVETPVTRNGERIATLTDTVIARYPELEPAR